MLVHTSRPNSSEPNNILETIENSITSQHNHIHTKAIANAITMSIDSTPSQTNVVDGASEPNESAASTQQADMATHHRLSKRPIEELNRLLKSEHFNPDQLTNEEIIDLMLARQVSVYRLESILKKSNANRCVEIRRQYYIRELELLDKLDQQQRQQQQQQQQHNPSRSNHDHQASSELKVIDAEPPRVPLESRADILKRPQDKEFDYSRVVGACCENVIGCVRLPVGLVGPLLLDDENIFVPLATSEGCLVASTSRGLSALAKSGGVTSRLEKNCMTRAPIVSFVDADLKDAVKNVDRAKEWLKDETNKEKIKAAFRSNSRYTRLLDYTVASFDREMHIRFEAQTGDAMGMNMCSKGSEMALREMQRNFPTMDIMTISGNMCTDKKAAAVNWIYGRGKSVECNATLPVDVVERVLKVTVDAICKVWLNKCMIGSAMAGSGGGGYNCHAANIVAAIFIATGQDAAQVVSSSNCMLKLTKNPMGHLEVSCKMPSIECGTVGGGTVLPDQSNYLQLMGIKGATDYASQNVDANDSQSNACKLARVICATVMAAELSLLASLTEGTLVKSHMAHNRSAQPCNVV